MLRDRTRWWFVALALAAALGGGCSDNDDSGTNPPIAKELDSPTLAAGANFVHVFSNAGTFPYRCSFHNGMTGSITVAPAGAESLRVNIANASTNGFQPVGGSTTIRAGAYVRWVNQDGTDHTVTSTP